jgi:cytidylate kinase
MSNNKDIKIAVSGKSGCGNTTVSKILADILEIRFINFTFRNLAQEKGLELAEVLEMAAKDDSWDREVDSRQVALAREEGGCVLGSRLAIWMLPEADLKVFLTAKPETRAGRIQKREGGDLQEIIAFTESRDNQDKGRYKSIYNIDHDDYAFVDLIIDTDEIEPKEIAEIIIEKLKEKIPGVC